MPYSFRPKLPSEQRPYSVALFNGLPPGVLVQSATVDISVETGTDSNPNGMKLGPAVVNTDPVLLKNNRFRLPIGTVVSQRLSGGAAGAVYRVRYTITMTDTNIIVRDILLPVVAKAPEPENEV